MRTKFKIPQDDIEKAVDEAGESLMAAIKGSKDKRVYKCNGIPMYDMMTLIMCAMERLKK